MPGPWYERLPHFRMGFTPSSGKELQSEYFVPRRNAVEAILAIERLRDQVSPHLMISELRTIDADDLWMSPCYKRPSLAIHFTWKPDWDSVREVLPMIEKELAPFEVRPHWGKLFALAPAQLQIPLREVGRLQGRCSSEHDPRGKFRNEFLTANLYSSPMRKSDCRLHASGLSGLKARAAASRPGHRALAEKRPTGGVRGPMGLQTDAGSLSNVTSDELSSASVLPTSGCFGSSRSDSRKAAAAPARSPTARRVRPSPFSAIVERRTRLQRAFEVRQRISGTPAGGERAGEIQQRLAIVRLALDRLAEQVHRLDPRGRSASTRRRASSWPEHRPASSSRMRL